MNRISQLFFHIKRHKLIIQVWKLSTDAVQTNATTTILWFKSKTKFQNGVDLVDQVLRPTMHHKPVKLKWSERRYCHQATPSYQCSSGSQAISRLQILPAVVSWVGYPEFFVVLYWLMSVTSSVELYHYELQPAALSTLCRSQ